MEAVSQAQEGQFDLHTHSAHSDGTTSPTAIVELAAQMGLAGVALTDHDTIDGWAEARKAADHAGIEFIPGVEITTKYDGYSVHLLAYGIDPEHTELQAELARIRMSRVDRAQEMVRRLSTSYDIDWAGVSAHLPEGATVGRPHIADTLVARGHFADRGEVFHRILHPASPFYVSTYAIDTVAAIRLVTAARGVSVLAHPAALRQRGPVPPDRVVEFQQAGLWGIELDHPENRVAWTEPLRAQAVEIGLEITGASDYHGAGKMNQLGERTSPVGLVNRLRDRVAMPR